MNTAQLKALNGQPVLVKPALSDDHNSVGMRGSIRVMESSGAKQRVEIVLGFPDMFNEPAHEKIIPLSSADLQRLVISEINGGYEFTLTEPQQRTVPSE